MTLRLPQADLLARLAERLGRRGFTTDAAEMAPWLTDWRGTTTGRAAALLSPADSGEVAFIVAQAAAARVGLVPQGGNTSMVAGATPPAEGGVLLLSLRRMNAIRSVSADDNVLVAEAGAILSDVHAAAEKAGRRFPLSLGAKGSATIGGLVSTNAGGTQVLRFGTMRSLVLGLEAILPDGALFDGLTALRKDNRGYDLRQLLIGAEGTLGVVTAVGLRLVAAAPQRAVAWVGLADAERALTLLRRIEAAAGNAIESFEVIPANALALVLRHIPGSRAPLATAYAWNVLVEVVAAAGGLDPGEALSTALADAIGDGLIDDAAVAASEAQNAAFWRLRDSISEAERQEGPAAKHDVSVAVAAMPAFMASAARQVEAAFRGARVIAFGHLGDGNVHFNVAAPAGADGARWLADKGTAVTMLVHDLVTAAGGSISAEHGIGKTRLAEFSRLADPARLGAIRAIKAALDPLGIMNPGKLVPPADPAREIPLGFDGESLAEAPSPP